MMATHTLYRFWDASGVLLYVGITADPLARWKRHKGEKAWWQEVIRVTVEHFATRAEVYAAETAAILAERPLYNRMKTRPPRTPRPAAKLARFPQRGPLEPRAGFRRVLTDLRRLLDEQAWRAGDRLPTERALAADYGVSRETVTRALNVLRGERRLVSATSRGTQVAPLPSVVRLKIHPASATGWVAGWVAACAREGLTGTITAVESVAEGPWGEGRGEQIGLAMDGELVGMVTWHHRPECRPEQVHASVSLQCRTPATDEWRFGLARLPQVLAVRRVEKSCDGSVVSTAFMVLNPTRVHVITDIHPVEPSQLSDARR